MSNTKQQTEVKQIKKHLELPHRETVISTNTLQTKPFDNQKIEIITNNKQSSVIKLLRLKEQLESNPWQYNWIIEEIDEIIDALNNKENDDNEQQ